MFSGKNPYDDIVAKATDENQTSEDWGVLSTVWDKVNDDGATGARNCVAAIQKRLQHRNANVQLYALTLSDSLVNNCGINLHREVSSRAFTQTLSRLVTDRTTHDKVKKRTMQLLKNWSETFKKDESLGIVEETYEALKKSHRYDDPQTQPDPVNPTLLRQEEEDMQRAIRESEALAAQQAQRPTGYVPATPSAHNSGYSVPQHQQPGQQQDVPGQFFTSADGKALPDIQSQPSTSNAEVATASKNPSRVKALYDFEPQEEGELAFRRGDIIRVVNSAYEGWWKGELDGRVGIFPLTYIEIIPDPTPESIARDAEVEAQVFAQAGSVDRLLALLSAADAQGSSISEDDELMELYQQCILLRPKIVKLLDKYSQKQKDLSSLHEKFKVAKSAYDQMLDESYQRSHQQRTQYAQQQPGPYGMPGQAGYAIGGGPAPGSQPQQRHGSFGAASVPHPAQGQAQPQYAQAGYPQQQQQMAYPGQPGAAPAPGPAQPAYAGPQQQQSTYPGQLPGGPSAHSPYAQHAPGSAYPYPPPQQQQQNPGMAYSQPQQHEGPRINSPSQYGEQQQVYASTSPAPAQQGSAHGYYERQQSYAQPVNGFQQ